MKTLETIRRFSRLGRTLSKTAFVLAVIGFCGCVLGIFSLALGSDGAIQAESVTAEDIRCASASGNVQMGTSAGRRWISAPAAGALSWR